MDYKEFRGSKYERSTKAFQPSKKKAFDDIDIEYFGTQIIEDFLDAHENILQFSEDERKQIKNKKIDPFTKIVKEKLRKNLKYQQYPINSRYRDYLQEKEQEKQKKQDKKVIPDFKI